MATLHFELVSPERVLFSGAVDSVILPAIEGQMTVLGGHAPLMTTLSTGFLVMTINDKPTRFLIRGGFADVNAAGLTILAENALPENELSKDVFAREIANAEKERDNTEDVDMRADAELALQRLKDIQAQFS